VKIETSLYQVALRLLGAKEIPGEKDHPFITWCISQTSHPGPYHDEIPWCSAFINGLCVLLGLPRSGSAAARSWLTVGQEVPIEDAMIGMDIVVLSRGDNPTAGHVGIFAGMDGHNVKILGGNQGDRVSIASFPASSVLGVRRLA